MIRYYCDICGDEVTDGGFTGNRLKGSAQVTSSLSVASQPINIEVICGVKGWNDGIICGPCLKSAVAYAFEHNVRGRHA